jgi:hypothetical protein
VDVSNSEIERNRRKYGVADKADSYGYYQKCMAQKGHTVDAVRGRVPNESRGTG